MEWEVLFTDAFGEWWDTLTGDQQDAVVDRVDLLQQHGPNLGRPTVDTISGSAHNNMKELRASKGGALRILFIFDPIRRAILLLGGNKSGQWEQWYREAIPAADALYNEYLEEIRKKGLIP
jgi:hypothetical protein